MDSEQKPVQVCSPKAQPRPDVRPLSVVLRSVAELHLDPQNPREHSRRQIRQIANSIRAFGFIVAILINPAGRIIAGAGRLLAARRLGMTHVPTICLDHLSEAQVRAFIIADNKLTENATWNERLLAEQFKTLSDVELDFDIDVTGFQMAEIDMMIEGLAPASPGKGDPADGIPEPETQLQVTQAGDIWILNKHRVCCGDARSGLAYAALMNARRAAMVFTDPPYNDPIDRYVTGFGEIHHPEFAMGSGEMDQTQFTEFLDEVFKQLVANSSDGALQYFCMDWRHLLELLTAARQRYAEFKNLCVWVKNVGGQGSLYRSQHELVCVFKNGKAPHRNNIQLGEFGRYRTNVWQYARVNSLARTTDEGDLSRLHPTIKPVELVADAILDCTARGDIVLDAFLLNPA